jgi:hypothetical protein
MALLGMPEVRAPERAQPEGMVTFAGTGHHFTVAGHVDVDGLTAAATAPLSVILQVTKRCNFDCNFCSETLQLPDPTLAELDEIRANLTGVRRVFLSGGEPLLRRDFVRHRGYVLRVHPRSTDERDPGGAAGQATGREGGVCQCGT